jgi:hypothetical protein
MRAAESGARVVQAPRPACIAFDNSIDSRSTAMRAMTIARHYA